MGPKSGKMEDMVELFANTYNEKKVLVTGNTGFKGSWLTEFLLQMGAQVCGYSIDVPTEPSHFMVCKQESRIRQVWGDVCDLEKFQKEVNDWKPDFVFHLAAQALVKSAYEDPVSTFRSNVMGTVNVLEVARRIDYPCIFVIITSDKCYENVEWTWGYRETDRLGGKDPYSASKGAAEVVAHAYFESFLSKSSNIKIATARAGNVIGGGDWASNRIVPDCYRAWSDNSPVTIRSPKATRPWQHVLEPLSGYLRLGQLLAFGKGNLEAYNFGPSSDQNKSVLELLESIAPFWTKEQQAGLFNIVPNPGMHEAGLLKLSCDKALHDLDWQPTLNFKETARFTGIWYSAYYNENANIIQELTSKQILEYVGLAKNRGCSWTK